MDAKLVFENLPEGVWQFDAEFRTTYVNSRMAAMLGCTPDELVGLPPTSFHDLPDDEIERYRADRRRGLGSTADVRFKTRTGTHVWARVSVVPILEHGAFAGQIAFVTDITDRVEAEATLRAFTVALEERVIARSVELETAQRALARSEANFRTLIEAAPFGILVHQNERIAYVNPAMCDMLVTTESQLVGQPPLVFAHPDDRAHIVERRERLSTDGHQHLEVRLRLGDGPIVWVEAASLVIEHDGAPAIAIVFRNITARREAEQKLRESLRDKEVLLKEIHHRVKNNLQVVSSMLYLQSRAVTDPVASAQLETSQARVRSISLVHEHLYRAKDLSRVDFADYIHSLTAGLTDMLEATTRGIAIVLDIAAERIEIDTAIATGLVVSELVSNAFKHAFPGGRRGTITVSLRRTARGLVLAVSDDGVGLPAGVDVRTATTLGLELVQAFTEQLHATLAISRDGGTRFELTLPARA